MPAVGSYLQPTSINGTTLKSYSHASRLYLDNLYALAPKSGWLYYVVFNINPAAITDPSWLNQQSQTEAGMLVKSADLPRFSAQTEVMNQYNRKTVIQKGLTYNPVTITMHDDMSNITHGMWLNYYKYHFADAATGAITQLANGLGQVVSGGIGAQFSGNGAKGLAGGLLGGVAGSAVSGLIGSSGLAGGAAGGFTPGNQYSSFKGIYTPTDYGMNSALVTAPFFRSITMYQMNRQLFTSYTLVNPIISGWDHDKIDQSNGSKLAESKMTVTYETVAYGVGQVKKDNPTGFAVFHYDNDPSPIGVGSGSSTGQGMLYGAADVFGNAFGIGNNGKNPINGLNAAVLGAGILTGGATNAFGGSFSVLGSLSNKLGLGTGFNGGPGGSNLNLDIGEAASGVYASAVKLFS